MLEANIQDAITELQTGSTSAPVALKLLALSESPTCTPEQFELITSAIYTALDDFHLQSSKVDKSFPLQQVSCLESLVPILVKGFASSDARCTLETLMSHWPTLHLWILYLKVDFVDKESVDLPFRLLAKKCIVDFLGLCDDSLLHDWFDTVMESPGIIATLVSLWRLETRDKRFALSDDPSTHPMFHVPATLDSWMCAFSHRERWDWSQILLPFGGEAAALAATALDRLREDIVRSPINHDLIIWDIHIITTLSVNDTIRMPLLKQHSMSVLVGVINSAAGWHVTEGQLTLVAKCVSYGYWYIRTYVESTDGLPWITQIVEAGLLSAMLSAEPWIKLLGGEDSEEWEPLFLLLGHILPQYAMYSSVLRPMIRQLTAIAATDLPGKLDKNGMLFNTWSTFEMLVRDRAALYRLTIKNETHIESCQNTKCDKSGPVGSFKSCAGCLHVHYCSKECQVYDWKNGGHSKYCRDIQARRADGLVSRLSKRDVLFIDRVIAQDLNLFRDRIQGAAMLWNLNPVVVELDYTQIPIELDIGSVSTVPQMHTCECDAPMTQKWNHMIKIAEKSASKRILVRALLPGGTSEKVKLQCLSLKRVLGDPGADEEQTSEFDETFDLLYSRAGQSFGVVDAAFPNEAQRAMKERMDMQGTKV